MSPHHNPEADRWGGPGASHENRKKPKPDPTVKDPDDPDHFGHRSRVSGGGGEGDIHHAHPAGAKRDFESSRAEKIKDEE